MDTLPLTHSIVPGETIIRDTLPLTHSTVTWENIIFDMPGK